MTEAATTTYILKLNNGNLRRITIPADWKVTFGPLAPGSKGGLNGPTAMTLRIYETKEKQRACFVDVVEFRDDSIPVEERVTKSQSQTLYRDTPEGRKQVVVEAQVKEWRNPDDTHSPEPEFTTLPAIEDMNFGTEE